MCERAVNGPVLGTQYQILPALKQRCWLCWGGAVDVQVKKKKRLLCWEHQTQFLKHSSISEPSKVKMTAILQSI